MQKNELHESLQSARKEIESIRQSLNKINDEKESFFQKRQDAGRKIRELISEVKELRQKRDALTSSVKDLKKGREELNTRLKGFSSELKTISSKKQEVLKKHKIKEDPAKIRTQIDRLEVKLETEVMSFEKEKQFNKQIKELRKRYHDVKDLDVVLGNFSEKSKEAYKVRDEAKKAHRDIQGRAGESQKFHEAMIAKSKEIDALRKEEDETNRNFMELKSRFTEINDQLKEKLKAAGDISSQLKEMSMDRDERILRSKEQLVEEKIKKGEKLTTEDLLVFQKMGK